MDIEWKGYKNFIKMNMGTLLNKWIVPTKAKIDNSKIKVMTLEIEGDAAVRMSKFELEPDEMKC